MLARNRTALDALAAELLEAEQLRGERVYELLQQHLCEEDRTARAAAAAAASAAGAFL